MSIPIIARNALELGYRITDEIERSDVDACLVHLGPDEVERCLRFVHWADQRDYAVAHAGLRHALSFYSQIPPNGWRFGQSARGKPFISPIMHASYTFNLSHTRGLVAYALAREGDVGIDVETCTSAVDLMDLARQNFSAGEISQLHACPPDARRHCFAEFWTLKEAFVKATGEGITGDLSQWGFQFEQLDRRSLRFMAPSGIDASEWTFALYAPTPDTRMAVAARRRDGAVWQIRAREFNGGHALLPLATS